LPEPVTANRSCKRKCKHRRRSRGRATHTLHRWRRSRRRRDRARGIARPLPLATRSWRWVQARRRAAGSATLRVASTLVLAFENRSSRWWYLFASLHERRSVRPRPACPPSNARGEGRLLPETRQGHAGPAQRPRREHRETSCRECRGSARRPRANYVRGRKTRSRRQSTSRNGYASSASASSESGPSASASATSSNVPSPLATRARGSTGLVLVEHQHVAEAAHSEAPVGDEPGAAASSSSSSSMSGTASDERADVVVREHDVEADGVARVRESKPATDDPIRSNSCPGRCARRSSAPPRR
jgi:hypothetical protein